MRIFLIFIFGFISMPSMAQQFSFEFWHSGKAVLDSGDTLRGALKYDMSNDILQVEVDRKLESFTSRKVLYFEIFDETVKRYRSFYSLPYSQGAQYKVPTFFELLEEGKLTVLCRELLEYRTTSSPFYFYGNVNRLVLINKYFILKENGELDEFGGKKNDWLDMMRPKSDDVEKFAKKNRLDFDDKYELGRIISYYNSLFKKN